MGRQSHPPYPRQQQSSGLPFLQLFRVYGPVIIYLRQAFLPRSHHHDTIIVHAISTIMVIAAIHIWL